MMREISCYMYPNTPCDSVREQWRAGLFATMLSIIRLLVLIGAAEVGD